MRPPLLAVEGLSRSFDGRTVIDGVDELRAGELVAFLGANGSGKSTSALRHGHLPAGHGRSGVERGPGRPAGPRAAACHRRTAMIFQKIHLVPRRSALDGQPVVRGLLPGSPPHGRFSSAGYFRQEHQAGSVRGLYRVGLKADRALDRVGRLSGGQQRRVPVARASLPAAEHSPGRQSSVFPALDPAPRRQVMSLLRDLTTHSENWTAAGERATSRPRVALRGPLHRTAQRNHGVSSRLRPVSGPRSLTGAVCPDGGLRHEP